MTTLETLFRRVFVLLAATWVFSTGAAYSAPPPKLQKVYESLESSNFKIRVKAIQVLAKSGDEGAAAAIRLRLKDADATVRAAACDALARLDDEEALPQLRGLLSDTSPLVARQAEEAIGVLTKKKSAKKGKSGRVVVVFDPPQNRTKMAGVEKALEEGARAKLAKASRVALVEQAGNVGYVVMLTVQTVEEKQQGGGALMHVSGAATVLELPGRQLKFSTRVTAGVGKDGTLTDADRKELADESARAAGEALGDELGKWMTKQ